MTTFEPRDPNFEARVTDSFDRQPFIAFLGGQLAHMAPGEIDIALPFKGELAQQYGLVHGGVLMSIADAAAGYAAMTLMAPDVGVLTTDFKVNFLRPAEPGSLTAMGRVLKPGRTLTVVQADVMAKSGGRQQRVLTGLVTMMAVGGLTEGGAQKAAGSA